ncbi:unnamed protein product [Miscanthus lutarioriparius]|uniref:Uncharacterized protein n=1 Tax=Miscanthus lutarioriparius TaxID=422564 RepID=A0A811MJH0_9POAL|nr:unnamed protein product [Miscanthus lutarioriparius]
MVLYHDPPSGTIGTQEESDRKKSDGGEREGACTFARRTTTDCRGDGPSTAGTLEEPDREKSVRERRRCTLVEECVVCRPHPAARRCGFEGDAQAHQDRSRRGKRQARRAPTASPLSSWRRCWHRISHRRRLALVVGTGGGDLIREEETKKRGALEKAGASTNPRILDEGRGGPLVR